MIILENATLADLTNGHLLPGHHIAVDGDRIVEVTDHPIRTETAERINLGGQCSHRDEW